MATESDSSTSAISVYNSLKKGSLLSEIGSFNKQQIQPYLPSLLSATFTSKCNQSDKSSDWIRKSLLQFSQCNTLLQILSTDFREIEHELHRTSSDVKSTVSFDAAKPIEKLKIVAIKLDILCKNIGRTSAALAEADRVFEQEEFMEEIVCAMTACALQRPLYFETTVVVHALLHLSNAVDLLTSFIGNVPDSLESVVEFLVASNFPDNDGDLIQKRNALLLKLLSLDPFLVEPSINRLLRIGTMNSNGLALTIICVCLRDSQLIEILLHGLLSSRSLALFIQKSSSKPAVKLLHDRLSEMISAFSTNSFQGFEDTMVHLMAALKILAGIRLGFDESNAWCLFLTRTDFESDSYVSAALSTMIGCPQLIPIHLSEEKEVESSIIAFLDFLKQRLSSNVSSSLQQFFILLSVHLHAGQSEQLSALVSSVLSFKVPINMRNLMTLKNLFLRYAISERDIAERASRMPVTEGLNVHHQGFLPAHCIAHLLSTNSFSKYSVAIKDWIGSQIVCCSTPLHPIVTDLLSAYASSCFSNDSIVANEPLSEKFFLKIFSGEVMSEEKMTARLLSLFFILCHRNNFEKRVQKIRVSYPYSEKLDEVMSIRFLLNVVESRPEDYQAIRSPLMRFGGIYYPYLLPTVDSLLLSMSDELKSKDEKANNAQLPSLSRMLSAVKIADREPSNIIHCMRILQRSSLRAQVLAKDVILEVFVTALDISTPASLTYDAVDIWKRLENVIPRELCEATVRVWTNLEIDHDMLVKQPLLLFKCDERLFENDLLFPCFLRMLSFYSGASRTVLSQKLVTSPNLSDENRMEREELTRSLIGAQDSTVVQILLEICGKFENVNVHRLCCGHIHQMFIADPILSKLVHFQGYPLRLIPLAVRQIPSMHICLEFVHEILAFADISKRVFAIVLITELAQQYKIESSFVRVELVVNVLTTLMRVATVDENLVLLYSVIPSLGTMMWLFPQTATEIAHLLSRASAIAAARLAISATVLTDQFCIERRVIKLVRETLCEASAKMATT